MSPVICHLSIPIAVLSLLCIPSTLHNHHPQSITPQFPPYCHFPHTSSSFSIHLLHPMILNLSTQPFISNHLVYLYKGPLDERASSSKIHLCLQFAYPTTRRQTYFSIGRHHQQLWKASGYLVVSRSLTLPACIKEVVTIGASTMNNECALFSNHGPCVSWHCTTALFRTWHF